MKTLITTALVALFVPYHTNAQEGNYPPPSSNSTGTGMWRSFAPWHYYSGECCYCLEATKARPSQQTLGETEFLVGETWWSMPNNSIRSQIKGMDPVGFYMICDPMVREYTCIIPGFAG